MKVILYIIRLIFWENKYDECCVYRLVTGTGLAAYLITCMHDQTKLTPVNLSTTGYTRKSGIIILLYFVMMTSPHSSITTLLVNFGRSFSFRSTTISYTDFVSLVPFDKRCYVGRNDRYEVGVRDKKHENSLPLDLHGVKFERISRIFDPTF